MDGTERQKDKEKCLTDINEQPVRFPEPVVVVLSQDFIRRHQELSRMATLCQTKIRFIRPFRKQWDTCSEDDGCDCQFDRADAF